MLLFTAPAPGVYTLEARNVEGKTGPDCFYRLEARRGAQSFFAHIEVERLSVGVDGAMALMVTVDRFGYDGPVRVFAENLPTGVTCRGGTLAAGLGGME